MKNDYKIGDKVKMSNDFKEKLKLSGDGLLGSASHGYEFGNCEGIVAGNPYNDEPDEFDVIWLPSGLKYCYNYKDLVKI